MVHKNDVITRMTLLAAVLMFVKCCKKIWTHLDVCRIARTASVFHTSISFCESQDGHYETTRLYVTKAYEPGGWGAAAPQGRAKLIFFGQN